jgi:hypothetical protein
MKLIVALLILLAPWLQPLAEDPPPTLLIKDVNAVYQFGEQIIFYGVTESPFPIDSIFLFIQPLDDQVRLATIIPEPTGLVEYKYDLGPNPIRAFTQVTYWFRLVSEDGSEFESPRFSFEYGDNRFPWQTADNSEFVAHWYGGDFNLGQTILSISGSGMENAKTFIPVTPVGKIHIYVYARVSDMQSALNLGRIRWVAGHASPDQGLILITAPPGPEQKLEIERQVPHELTHILQYWVSGKAYDKIPSWLMEGMATLSEIFPDPQYQSLLKTAAKEEKLIPLSDLCQSFPADAEQAMLSYAQSASFLSFIQENYGIQAVQKIFKDYIDGMGCSEAMEKELGINLVDLETRWRMEALGIDNGVLVLQNLIPYLIALVLIILPLGVTTLAGLVKRRSDDPAGME